MANIKQALIELETELKFFMPTVQIEALKQTLAGEEGEAIAESVLNVTKTIRDMPKTYETDGQGMDATAYLHYFMGDIDAWITEKDAGDGSSDKRQHQAFGMVSLGGGFVNAEIGYVSIEELIENDVELDLYFNPIMLRHVK